LAVNDLVSITGFTEDKFLELDNVFPVKEITANTFTIYYKNEIAGTTNPISANLKAQSFALNNIYDVTSFSLSQVTTAEETSSLKLYFNNNYTGLFVAGQIIDLNSILNSSLNINGQYQIISVTEVAGESNDFLTIKAPRVVAGTYTTDLGKVTLYDTNYKFKVGDNDNSMSYNSYTGALTVTGTINASSGNFTNAVTVGKPNLSYSVSNKQLTTNQATLTTSTVHSFVVGDSVTVSGVDATFNGTYTVTGVPTGETFIYAKTAGNVASTAVSPVGTVSRGEANEGTVFVGYGANQITINGTGTSTTSAIFAGVGNYGNADTGFFLDASGRFSLGSALTWDGATLTISGAGSGIQPGNGVDVNGSNQITQISGNRIRTGVIESTGYSYTSGNFSTTGTQLDLSDGLLRSKNFAILSDGSAFFKGSIAIGSGNSIFKADANGIYLGNATFASAPFRVTPAGALTATGATITGTINASGGTFSGNITSSATITGGKIVTGSNAALGENVSSTKDGLFLDSNNYFFRSSATPFASEFRVGSSSNFLKINSSDASTRLQIDTTNSTYAVEVSGTVRATTVRATNFIGSFEGTLTGTAGNANNAAALDSLDSTQFLRSDASDTFAAGSLTIAPTSSNADFVFVGGGSTYDYDPILRTNGSSHAFGRIGIPTNRMFRGDFSSIFVGTTSISSDERVKTSIENSDLGLDFINMLRPVKYKMINGLKKQFDEQGNLIENLPGTRWHYGLIAQELKQTLDTYSLDSAMWSVEDFEENPDGFQAINYNQVTSPLIKAVQELSETVEILKNRLAALES
jgi:hypothetical protein